VLQDFLATGVLAFILTFTRMGTAIMIMPGLGDSFVPERIRLHIALGISFVLFPLAVPYMPNPMPGTIGLLSLVAMEFIIGVFFGTVARIFMMALDTAGMVISISSSLSNAQMFNPSLATQGSLMGAFLSVTGVVFLFVTDLYHLLIGGLVQSYKLFPVGAVPQSGDMADLIARVVSKSFMIGIQIGAPFLVLTLVMYIGMGVLSRLMPQMQVFMIGLPVQILVSLVILMMMLSAGYLFWAREFEAGMMFFFENARSG
jgi:flagellar biosynthetic protein FliR